MVDLGACPTCREAGRECPEAARGLAHSLPPRITDGRYEEVVVLDAADDRPRPDYVVTGWAWCISCRRQVWLGDVTGPAVVLRGVAPLCLPCANEQIKRPADSHRTTLKDTVLQEN